MRTYGQAVYEPPCWAVTCEPQVSLRLKRVFGKLAANSFGKHTISDTVENARDLEWFMERYPLAMSAGDAARLSDRANAHRARQRIVESIFAPDYRPPDFALATPARDYQKLAAAMLLERGGLLLADDLGLGKTASAICALTDARTLPAVVVTMAHLPRQWRSELDKFAPALKVHIVKVGTPYEFGLPDVVILNYHKLAKWSEALGEYAHSVVFDECQELRKTGSAKYAGAKHLAECCNFRCGLSATPFYNYGGEMWSVMDVLFPGEMGTFDEFATEWCNRFMLGADKARVADPAALGMHLRETGMMLRRTRKDVGRELPALQTIPHYVDSDPEHLNKVRGSCVELARLILDENPAARGAKMQAAEELSNAMRQATGIAKAPYVADFVRLLIESGERVTLYGWHREVYSIWLDSLKDLSPAMYTGSESPAAKEAAKQRFISGETPLVIISLRSGAGLDGLQMACRTVVFGELDWAPGVLEQCIGRVYRDGQPEPVTVYYLLADGGSDPIMAEVLGVKRMQIDGIRMMEGSELIEKLQNDGSHIRKLAASVLGRAGA